MGDSRKLDVSQRQELVWLLDEADSAIEPWWQTEEVRWPEILTKLVSRLRLCGFDLEAEGIASDMQATPKVGMRGCRNRRELRQLRQRVVEKVRKRIAAIRKVAADEPKNTAAKKPKQSTVRGEGRAKLIAALTEHHKYADDSCLNQEPIGVNALTRLAGVRSNSTASEFFKKEFGGHDKYKAACLNTDRQWKIATQLKVMNGEFSVFRSLDGDPSSEDGHEPERDNED